MTSSTSLPIAMRTRWLATASRQSGLSLIELMVGLAIGLLVVLAGTGSLLVTRQGSTTVSDSYRLTTEGNNAMRLIGSIVRQAGAAELAQAAVNTPVSFQNMTLRAFGPGGDQLVVGTDGGGAAPDQLVVYFQHRNDAVTRDCLGASPGAPGALTVNTFLVNGSELRCNGQALVGDNATPNAQPAVEDFQVWYWTLDAIGRQQRVTAADVPAAGGWPAVQALEVCLQLRGIGVDYPRAGVYTNCQGNAVAHDGRLHQVFRNTYKLRNRM